MSLSLSSETIKILVIGTEIFIWLLIFIYIVPWKGALITLESPPRCQIFWHAVVFYLFIYKQCFMKTIFIKQCFMKNSTIFGHSFHSLYYTFTGTSMGYIQSTSLFYINRYFSKLFKAVMFFNFKYKNIKIRCKMLD